MWINPRYADQIRPPAPPPDLGRRLATLARGHGSELRVSLASYEGRPYVSFKVWEVGQDGKLWPTKGKGTCSVRVAELEDVISALQQARSILEDGDPDGDDEAAGPDDHARYPRARQPR